MRAFLWVGLLAVAACGEVVKQQQQQVPDAAETIADAAVDAVPDAPPDPSTPRVVSVTAPANGIDAEGGTGIVTATLAGPPNTQFTVTFTGQHGTYAPATASVTTNASGQA